MLLPMGMAAVLAAVAGLFYYLNPTFNRSDWNSEVRYAIQLLAAPKVETREHAALRLVVLKQQLDEQPEDADPTLLLFATDPLLNNLEDRDHACQLAALRALCELGLPRKRGTVQLLKVLEERKKDTHAEYALKLLQGHDLRSEVARRTLKSVAEGRPHGYIMSRAADMLLAATPESERVPLALGWLDHPDAELAKVGVKALQSNIGAAISLLLAEWKRTGDANVLKKRLDLLDPRRAQTVIEIEKLLANQRIDEPSIFKLTETGIETDAQIAAIVRACLRHRVSLGAALFWLKALDIEALDPELTRDILPFVLRHLDDDELGFECRQCLTKHAKSMLPGIEAQLQSQHPGEIIQACRALQLSGLDLQPWAPRMFELLHHEDWDVVREATGILHNLAKQQQDILLKVIGLVGSKEYRVQAACLGILEALGPRAGIAVPALLEQFHAEKYFAYRLAKTLGKVGAHDPRVLAAFVSALQADRVSLGDVAEGIAAMGVAGRAAEPALLKIVGQSRGATEHALKALYYIGSDVDKALPALRQAMLTANSAERLDAVANMGAAARYSNQAMEYLFEALQDRNDNVRWEAAAALVKLEKQVFPYKDRIKARLTDERHSPTREELEKVLVKIDKIKR